MREDDEMVCQIGDVLQDVTRQHDGGPVSAARCRAVSMS